MEREIQVSTTLRAPLSTASRVLREDPGAVFSPTSSSAEDRRQRRFTLTMSAPVASGAGLGHDIEVRVGTTAVAQDEVRVPLDWEPVGHERLVPSFHGVMTMRAAGAGRTSIELSGAYEVPLGPVGRFGDAVVGRRVARESVSRLLAHLAGNLDREVDRRTESRPPTPTPYTIDLRETDEPALPGSTRPEHFIG